MFRPLLMCLSVGVTEMPTKLPFSVHFPICLADEFLEIILLLSCNLLCWCILIFYFYWSTCGFKAVCCVLQQYGAQSVFV